MSYYESARGWQGDADWLARTVTDRADRCRMAVAGDASWSVSTGIGACMAAALYEVGRPARLSVDEAQELERRWQDFGACQIGPIASYRGCQIGPTVSYAFRCAHARFLERTSQCPVASAEQDQLYPIVYPIIVSAE
jgi:hypothetical protein